MQNHYVELCALAGGFVFGIVTGLFLADILKGGGNKWMRNF